jgi:hypothetical protein
VSHHRIWKYFWGVTPYSLVETYRRNGGTYCLHFHYRIISRTINNQSSTCCLLLTRCLFNVPWPWKWRRYYSPNCQWPSVSSYGAISPKKVPFISPWECQGQYVQAPGIYENHLKDALPAVVCITVFIWRPALTDATFYRLLSMKHSETERCAGFAWQANSSLLAQNHDDVTMVMAPRCGNCAAVKLWQVTSLLGSVANWISAVSRSCSLPVGPNARKSAHCASAELIQHVG